MALQKALALPKEVPPFVTATSTFLSLVYPGQGLEKTLQQEHVERMNGHDFMKVMQVHLARTLLALCFTLGCCARPHAAALIPEVAGLAAEAGVRLLSCGQGFIGLCSILCGYRIYGIVFQRLLKGSATSLELRFLRQGLSGLASEGAAMDDAAMLAAGLQIALGEADGECQ